MPGQRQQQAQGKHRQERPQDIGHHRLSDAAAEAETDIAIHAVARVEGQGADHDPGKEQQEDQAQNRPCRREEFGDYDIDDEDGKGNQSSDQDLQRSCRVLEAAAVDIRIAVEVLLVAHLGPGRVDAESQDREQDIDDPDLEIFEALAVELYRELPRLAAGGGFGVRGARLGRRRWAVTVCVIGGLFANGGHYGRGFVIALV